MRPATRDAAIDYLRGTLIEHYQHLWVASSRAERVILDNLARGRVVNISAALALRSLIRRGLVVLDPEPRLINASFAAFVRQAERPDAALDKACNLVVHIGERVRDVLHGGIPRALHRVNNQFD